MDRWLRRLGIILEGRKGALETVPPFKIIPRNTMNYHKNTLKTQNVCATLLIVIEKIGDLTLWIIIWKIGLELKQQRAI